MLFLEQHAPSLAHAYLLLHVFKCSSLDAGRQGKSYAYWASNLLPELGEDSTLEQEHVIAISHVELQPHGSVQLTIVFHHPLLHSFSIHSTLFRWWTISWCRHWLPASHTCLSGHSYRSFLILSVHYQFCPYFVRLPDVIESTEIVHNAIASLIPRAQLMILITSDSKWFRKSKIFLGMLLV